MANIDCTSCEELREESYDFATNGVTNTVCTSLKNDTGFNTSNGNNDCEDLDKANDCLIGIMDDELESYDVCDWKKFMHKFIPNLHQLLKAMICAICGIWTNIHSLWSRLTNLEDRTETLCKLVDQIVTPALSGYGTLPLAETAAAQARRCGTPTSTVIKMPDDGTLNPYTKSAQNIGIAYASMIVQNCTTGKRQMIEWIAPSHYMYKLATNASNGDILWKIKKSEAQSVIGISDHLWDVYEKSSWTWFESALSPSRQKAWIRLSIGTTGLASDEMGLTFLGCDAPNDPITSDQVINSFNNSSARTVRHNID